MYEDVCYKEPFLKEVIVRVDFSSPIGDLEKTLPPKVANAALVSFPVSEPRKALAQELQLSGKAIQHKSQEFIEWNYYGRNREKRLAISPAVILATYSRYSTYETLKKDFLPVLSVLLEAFPDLKASRLGLRYINNIEMVGDDPLRWNDYIDNHLLGLFERFKNRQNTNRIFNIVGLIFDDLQVNFQFGVPNPDFPAAIRRPLFVLDIDAYFQGLQELDQFSKNIDCAHKKIQALFEESITDRLRERMNVKRD